ncbi:sulfotransferase family cytosolic 1B member 1-like [Drosophila ficusphila]|uniref:sulfotransferase family cytosolic 1B member 1-like n=1 Tax=Drosophila ficusphila TaxID=30025 RepID=UPI0007E6FC70|nr:sulfotransferase family cytosolic 1B member 1-like [Drosophila ficusphila]
MYTSRSLDSSATMPMIQIQCNGPQGLGPDWVPLEQDWKARWCTLPAGYSSDFAQRIDAFETRKSDVFVVTFMKCGTTWMQELAWLLLNNLNFERAKSSFPFQRSPFLEYSSIDEEGKDTIDECNNFEGDSRLIKSHLPAQLLPRQIWTQGRKVIYVCRNPKDVVVSSYHHMTGLFHWEGSLDDYVDQFVADKILYTSYWAHIIDFYRMRENENIFFVTYEEMKRDLKDVVKRLSRFLECKDLNDNEMEKLLNHLSFQNIKGSKFGNPTAFIKTVRKTADNYEFIRRGIVGSYKDELSPDQQKKVDATTRDFLKQYGVTEHDIFGEF